MKWANTAANVASGNGKPNEGDTTCIPRRNEGLDTNDPSVMINDDASQTRNIDASGNNNASCFTRTGNRYLAATKSSCLASSLAPANVCHQPPVGF